MEQNIVNQVFTKNNNEIDATLNNLNINCLTSRNNNFSLDSDGNLIVKSITTTTSSSSNNLTFNDIYPVGSIYMSVNSTNPSALFGGSWQQIKDRFLLASGSSYSAGTTGGEANHRLTISEMPSHNHDIYSQGGEVYNGQGWVARGINGYDSSQAMGCIVNAGGNQSHNNMPPYLAVYIWKRTS